MPPAYPEIMWCHGNNESWRVRDIVERTGFPPLFMGFVTIGQYWIGPRGGLHRSSYKMLSHPWIYYRADLGQEPPFPEATWCEQCGFVFTGGWHERDYDGYMEDIERTVNEYHG